MVNFKVQLIWIADYNLKIKLVYSVDVTLILILTKIVKIL